EQGAVGSVDDSTSSMVTPSATVRAKLWAVAHGSYCAIMRHPRAWPRTTRWSSTVTPRPRPARGHKAEREHGDHRTRKILARRELVQECPAALFGGGQITLATRNIPVRHCDTK